MTVCSPDQTLFLIGLLITIAVSVIVYRLSLRKFGKKKAAIIYIILFIVLLLASIAVSEFFVTCTGPLIGPNGEILG